MLSRESSPDCAVDGSPRFVDSVEHLSGVCAIMRSIDIARSAARNEVCRNRFATVFARDQVIELRTFDRQRNAAVHARETVTM